MSRKRGCSAGVFLAVFTLLFSFVGSSYSATHYIYDDGNRLIRVEYENGSKLEYAYDGSGNRTVKVASAIDTAPPVTIATPPGGAYDAAQNVALTCSDGEGTGCSNIYYTTDGAAPSTSSAIYSAPIAITATTTLKFFAIDFSGNTETVKTETYTINASGSLVVTLRKDTQNVLTGVHVYLFNEGGNYLGQAKIADASGQATFSAGPGRYKIRADYLGYQFWSEAIQVTTSASTQITIPHHTVNISVNGTYRGSSSPISGANVYLFTPAGAYQGVSAQTANDGKASFSLPAKDYKVRADYLSRQYFSSVFNAQDTAVNIPMAEAEVAVMQESMPLNGVRVYAFTTANSYLGINGATNASGKVTFRLPADVFKFRADYLGNQYWSADETLIADQAKPVAINTGGGAFTLTVLKGASETLAGVKCYVFSEAGNYLGLSGTTDSSGKVIVNLSRGNYKFRVDYLGYQHWTDIASVPTAMAMTKTIAHQNVTITVTGNLAGDTQAKAGVKAYLFTPAGSYLGMSATTDSNGQAIFNLPQQSYKVRADYLSRQFWSDVFAWEHKTVAIPEGTARVHVTSAGQNLTNVPVYVFNGSGTYLGITGATDSAGIKEFRLPAGDYKFRADYQGNQYWATATIAENINNPVELSTGGGQFTLTLDTGSGPLTGVKVYLFHAAGTYLGASGTSNSSGQTAFALADGNYKFRIDYLGYQFWTDVYAVPSTLSATYSIPHQNSTITVEKVYQGSQPLSGANVYLFTPSGTYLGKSQATNSAGQAVFSLPNKEYKVRIDYLGSQFWSGVFQFQNATVSLPHGMAQVAVSKTENPASNVPVYVFSEGGSYLGLNARTNANGIAEFLLPEKSFKYRADVGGTQYWSAVSAITAGQVNPVAISIP